VNGLCRRCLVDPAFDHLLQPVPFLVAHGEKAIAFLVVSQQRREAVDAELAAEGKVPLRHLAGVLGVECLEEGGAVEAELCRDVGKGFGVRDVAVVAIEGTLQHFQEFERPVAAELLGGNHGPAGRLRVVDEAFTVEEAVVERLP